MIFMIGTVLVGSHLLFLMFVAKLCSELLPFGGLTVFLILAVLSGFGMLRIQTWIESYFIAQHIKKRPNSGWKVVAKSSPHVPTSKPKREHLGNDGPGMTSGDLAALELSKT